MSTLQSKPYISVDDACAIAGISDVHMRRLLTAGTIKGMKLNERAWAVEKKSAEKFASKAQKTGRPRGGRNVA